MSRDRGTPIQFPWEVEYEGADTAVTVYATVYPADYYCPRTVAIESVRTTWGREIRAELSALEEDVLEGLAYDHADDSETEAAHDRAEHAWEMRHDR